MWPNLLKRAMFSPDGATLENCLAKFLVMAVLLEVGCSRITPMQRVTARKERRILVIIILVNLRDVFQDRKVMALHYSINL